MVIEDKDHPDYDEFDHGYREGIRAMRPEIEKLRKVAIDCGAHLTAAISLLENSPKTAAPSDKMFNMMLDDYRRSLERMRAALKGGDDG